MTAVVNAVAIESFKGANTGAFFEGIHVARFQKFEKIAIRKLQVLHSALSLNDLAVVPGNRLEKLGGNRAGHFSLRINDRWRVCFKWRAPDANNVEITDHYK